MRQNGTQWVQYAEASREHTEMIIWNGSHPFPHIGKKGHLLNLPLTVAEICTRLSSCWCSPVTPTCILQKYHQTLYIRYGIIFFFPDQCTQLLVFQVPSQQTQSKTWSGPCKDSCRYFFFPFLKRTWPKDGLGSQTITYFLLNYLSFCSWLGKTLSFSF